MSHKHPNSGGSVPHKSGRRCFERDTNADMRKALDKALERLGEPSRDYRKSRDRFVRNKLKAKDQ